MSSTAVGMKLAGPANEKYRDQWELVQKARAGDQQAWSEVIELVREMVKRVIWRMVGNTELSKDLMQDTFLKMFTSIGQWKGEANFKTWVHTIAVTSVLMYRRKEWVRSEAAIEVKVFVGDKHLDQVGLRLDLMRLLFQIPYEQRKLLVRHYLDEEQMKDIAREEGMTLHMVKSHLFRGRRGLRELFENQKEML